MTKVLDHHTITLKNEIFTFALIFDIPAEFEVGGGFSGPEDPRIIIEGSKMPSL